MNSTYHEAVKNTPYQALTGNKTRRRLSFKISEDFIAKRSPSINRRPQGVIKGRLVKNQFECIKCKGINVATLPEIVLNQSTRGGQGFKKCSCRSHSHKQLNELMKLHVNNLQFTGLSIFAIIFMPSLVKKSNLLVQVSHRI